MARRFAAIPLSLSLARRRALPARMRPVSTPVAWYDDDQGITARTLIDEPREPVLQPIGVLDARGQMLIRVSVPVKQKLGFFTGGNAWTGAVLESVEAVVPADMLQVSSAGLGIGGVSPGELEDDDDETTEFVDFTEGAR